MAGWRQLASTGWPVVWTWWQRSLLLAPLVAAYMVSTRVPSVEELEEARAAQQTRARVRQEHQMRTRLSRAPDQIRGALVLGVPLGSGDLPWREGDYVTYPAAQLARHAVVLGSSGMGKSETVLRLATGARRTYGWKVFLLDCKGDQQLQERFVASMRAAGAGRIGMFPHQPLAGWQGDPITLLNRLLAVLEYHEPYYKDLTKLLLHLALHAPGGPPRSSADLLGRLRLAYLRQAYAGQPDGVIVDELQPRDVAAAANRYRSFFSALQGGLDGDLGAVGWSFDQVEAGAICLDGLSLKDQTASLGRVLLEDFAHYVARRKPANERVLLIIDEYPVIAENPAGMASLFEQVRFHGASIMVTGQSYAGMGAGIERILGAAETLILHRCGDPEPLVARAGQRLHFSRRVRFAERGLGTGARDYATGGGDLGVTDVAKIQPSEVQTLAPGECYVIAGGCAQRVLVQRVPPPVASQAASTQASAAILPVVRNTAGRAAPVPAPPPGSADAPDAPLAPPPPSVGSSSTYADEDGDGNTGNKTNRAEV